MATSDFSRAERRSSHEWDLAKTGEVRLECGAGPGSHVP